MDNGDTDDCDENSNQNNKNSKKNKNDKRKLAIYNTLTMQLTTQLSDAAVINFK